MLGVDVDDTAGACVVRGNRCLAASVVAHECRAHGAGKRRVLCFGQQAVPLGQLLVAGPGRAHALFI